MKRIVWIRKLEKDFSFKSRLIVDILKAHREEDNSCKRGSEDVQADDIPVKRDEDQDEKWNDSDYVVKDVNECEKKVFGVSCFVI